MTPRKRPTGRTPSRKGGGIKSGPLPMILKGFDRRMLRIDVIEPKGAKSEYSPPDPWTEHAPCRRALMAARAGATPTMAAQFAKIQQRRITDWNRAGQDATTENEDLVALEESGLDDETLAAAAFYVLWEQAVASPGVGALSGIAQASRGDWRAGLAMLRILPATKRDYSEIQKLEHSGPDDGPIPVEVRARALADVLRQRRAAGDEGEDPDAVEDDGAGDG